MPIPHRCAARSVRNRRSHRAQGAWERTDHRRLAEVRSSATRIEQIDPQSPHVHRLKAFDAVHSAGDMRAAQRHAPPRLLDRVRQAIRTRHYSRRTEVAYVGWLRVALAALVASNKRGERRSLIGSNPSSGGGCRPARFGPCEGVGRHAGGHGIRETEPRAANTLRLVPLVAVLLFAPSTCYSQAWARVCQGIGRDGRSGSVRSNQYWLCGQEQCGLLITTRFRLPVMMFGTESTSTTASNAPWCRFSARQAAHARSKWAPVPGIGWNSSATIGSWAWTSPRGCSRERNDSFTMHLWSKPTRWLCHLLTGRSIASFV